MMEDLEPKFIQDISYFKPTQQKLTDTKSLPAFLLILKIHSGFLEILVPLRGY